MKQNVVPEYSIVIPTYNNEQSLFNTIESVLNQRFRNFELIVVDDGSTDRTVQVIQSFSDGRIQYIYQDNKGAAAARNTGAQSAKGKFITFLDSDDIVLNNWLESFYKKLKSDNVGLVFSGCIIKRKYGDYVETIELPRNLGPSFYNQSALYYAGTFAFRRLFFDDIGGYSSNLAYSENTELILRLIPACLERGYHIDSIQEPLIVYYKYHEVNKISPDKLYNSAVYILEHHNEKLLNDPPNFAVFSAIAGVNAAKLRKYSESLYHLGNALKADALNWKNYIRFLMGLIPPIGRIYWIR